MPQQKTAQHGTARHEPDMMVVAGGSSGLSNAFPSE
jgi:hypothetical protein